jgi:NAD(P)H-dependent FMN reductase
MARLAVLYGSVRSARQGIRAARFVVDRLGARGHEVTFLDARELDLPLLDRMHKEYEDAPEPLARVSRSLEAAEGIVVVTGEYNHGLPPGLKNLLDHFQREYYFKPAAVVSYSAGAFGGVRAAVHLRGVLGELGMAVISTELPVPKVQKTFDEDGTPREDEEAWARRLDRLAGELEWYVEALSAQRAKRGRPF